MSKRRRGSMAGGKSRGPGTCRFARRGSSYVMVLSLATVLTVVGLSAITISRVRTRGTVQANDWTDAQMLAFSATEHALTTINDDPNWRSNLQGQTIQRTLNGKTFSWQVVDEADGDLTDNSTDPATLRVTGSAGQAVYSLKVDLAMPSGSGGGAGGSGSTDKTLWGVNQDDGMLFSIDDYTSANPQVTRYGQLKYLGSGGVGNLPVGIESFTIDTDGYAYMVLNAWLDSLRYPVLLRFNLANASTTEDNVVEVIGRINWSRNVTGIDFDLTTGKLYALGCANPNHGDRLLIISKTGASIIRNVGEMKAGGVSGRKVEYGEGLAFNANGVLYVIDNDYNRLYRVNKSTAVIEETVDEGMASSGYYEAIAWDPVHNRLLGSNTGTYELFEITLRDGYNIFWLDLDAASSLKSVEGMGFNPATGSNYNSTAVRPIASSSAITRVVE